MKFYIRDKKSSYKLLAYKLFKTVVNKKSEFPDYSKNSAKIDRFLIVSLFFPSDNFTAIKLRASS